MNRVHVKGFSQFVSEASHYGGIARVDLNAGLSDEFATVEYQGHEVKIPKGESLRQNWQRIMDAAKSMGAIAVYSYDEDEIVTQEDVDQLDDLPDDW